MDIKVKTLHPDGSVHFEGTLTPNEVSFILETGINFLVANGAQPFIDHGGPDEEDDDEPFLPHPEVETVQ